jgi:hypothetical protein
MMRQPAVRFPIALALLAMGSLLQSLPLPDILEKNLTPGVRTIQETVTQCERIYLPTGQDAILIYKTNTYTNLLTYDPQGYMTESILYHGSN